MRITKRQLKKIIREEVIREEKQDADLAVDELESLNLPPILKRLLDPDVIPATSLKYSLNNPLKLFFVPTAIIFSY